MQVGRVVGTLVATRKELEILKALVDRTAAAVFAEKGRTLAYHVGTMIELPRAALMAGEPTPDRGACASLPGARIAWLRQVAPAPGQPQTR